MSIELREDGSAELREDGSYELREESDFATGRITACGLHALTMRPYGKGGAGTGATPQDASTAFEGLRQNVGRLMR